MDRFLTATEIDEIRLAEHSTKLMTCEIFICVKYARDSEARLSIVIDDYWKCMKEIQDILMGMPIRTHR